MDETWEKWNAGIEELIAGLEARSIFNEFDDGYEKVIAQLVKMIDKASLWIIKPRMP